MSARFYMCEACENLAYMVSDSGVTPMCCGLNMVELTPEYDDTLGEKHVPVCSIQGQKITVDIGSMPHPMDTGHYIKWICINTEQGIQIKYLKAGDKPQVEFMLTAGDSFKEVYAFCNKHGLWKAVAVK